MKNLRYHFPTSYTYSVKEPIRGISLKRALDEDTGVFSFLLFPFFNLLLHWVRQPFLGIPSVILGVFVFFFILIFSESLALYAKSRGLIYTILVPKVK